MFASLSKASKFLAAGVVLILLAAIWFFFFVTKFSTAPDQTGLHYSAGPFSSTEYADCVEPGTRVWNGPADIHVAYPSGQRTYDFSANSAAPDSSPIVVASKDFQELTVSGVVTFRLNTDCDVLREFHEQIGNKYDARMDGNAMSDGWREMLSVYMNQPLQRAMSEATQGLDWKVLYNDPATKTAWEAEVSRLLPTYIKQQTGSDFFTDFSLTLQKPTPPAELLTALKDQQVAVEQNIAQAGKNQTVRTEAESIRELVNILGPDGYNVYQAIKDGKINVMPIPQGSSVIVGGSTAVPAG
jgi:regulator of protease activity HflC (stomatin/prohibitin superfamily)